LLSSEGMNRPTVAIIAGSILFSTSLARAETSVPWDMGPPCATAEPVVPSKMPANVPGIAIRGEATSVSLLAPDGTTIPVTVGVVGSDGYAIATWSASLTPGTDYTFRWSDSCSGGRTRTFRATETRPLPTTAGTVAVVPRSVTMPCDEAGRPYGVAAADVRLTPSAELAPLMEIAATDLVVAPDASFVSGEPYGAAGSGLAGFVGQKCPFGPRDFTASVRVRLPNGPTLTTASIPFSLPCPTTCVSEPTYTPDASAEGTGGSDAGVGSSGGAPDPKDETITARCSTSPGASGPTALVLAALVLASCGHVARRRRHRG
jgi:hypothetical protein